MDMHSNLSGKYVNRMNFPKQKDYPTIQIYHEKIALYRAYDRSLVDQFKVDALEELGLSNHPKAQKLFDLCYEDGHSEGLWRVWDLMQEWGELLSD